MKLLLLILLSMNLNAAETLKALLSSDISNVKTQDDIKSGTRHRVIFRSQLGAEGYQLLQLEKFIIGKYGNPDKVLFSKETFISDLPTIKEYIVELSKKSTEATFGCCDLKDLVWNEAKLSFKVVHGEKQFSCNTSELDPKTFKFECNNLEVVKTIKE